MDRGEGSLGVVGLNALQVAESAQDAGLDVYLVDYFCDSDVKIRNHFSMQTHPLKPDLGREYSAGRLVDYAVERLEGLVGDVVLTSAVGCNPDLVKRVEKRFNVVGNGSREVGRARDWRNLRRVVEGLGVCFPRTRAVDLGGSLRRAAEGFRFPVVLKSVFEAGGFSKKIFYCMDELDDVGVACRDVLVQEFIAGVPVSCSVLSTGSEAVSLTVNRQMMGECRLNASGLTYCGNIVPYASSLEGGLKKVSRDLVLSLGLVGSNGVDFVLGDDGGVYVLEVNTRFQDTLWGVERRLGMNLVRRHMDAVEGEVNHGFKENRLFYGKGVFFADRPLSVTEGIDLEGVRNVPRVGALIRGGEPVCSIYAEGGCGEVVWSRVVKAAENIREPYLSPVQGIHGGRDAR